VRVGNIIVASGAIGTQVGAVITLIVGMLAVVEIVLVSYLATPAKTQAVLRLLHNWVSAHRPQVLIAISAVVGFSLVANGMCMAASELVAKSPAALCGAIPG